MRDLVIYCLAVGPQKHSTGDKKRLKLLSACMYCQRSRQKSKKKKENLRINKILMCYSSLVFINSSSISIMTFNATKCWQVLSMKLSYST